MFRKTFCLCHFAIFNTHHLLSLLDGLFNLSASGMDMERKIMHCRCQFLGSPSSPTALRLPKVTFSSCLSAFRCLKGLRRAQWANLMCLSFNVTHGSDRAMKDSLFWRLGTCFVAGDDYAINCYPGVFCFTCRLFPINFIDLSIALPQEDESKPKHTCVVFFGSPSGQEES